MATEATELETLRAQLQEELEKQRQMTANLMKNGKSKSLSKEPPQKRPRHAPKPRIDQNGTEGSGQTPLVTWRKYPELTDELLTLIERNDVIRAAFGFKKSENSNNSGQSSLTIKDHCKKLADTLLIKHPSGKWANYTEDELWNVVKQRVFLLKKKFTDIRAKIEATGQDIPMDEDNDDPERGGMTPLGKTRIDFPWYNRMMVLMQDIPAVDTFYNHNATTTTLDERLRDLAPGGTRSISFDLPVNGAADTSAISEDVDDLDVESEIIPDEHDLTPSPESRYDTRNTPAPAPAAPTTFTSQFSISPHPTSHTRTSRPLFRERERERERELERERTPKRTSSGCDGLQDQLSLVLTRNRETRERLLKLKLESRLLEQKQAQEAQALQQRQAQEAEAVEADKKRAHEIKLMEMKIQLAWLQKSGNINGFGPGPGPGGPFSNAPANATPGVPVMPQAQAQVGQSQLSFPSVNTTPDSFASNTVPGS